MSDVHGWLRISALTVGFSCLLGACGPVGSLVNIADAKVALATAEEAGAAQTAPYHYYLAREYVYKAREENGRGRFDLARRYAKKAERAAKEARTKAAKASRYGTGGQS